MLLAVAIVRLGRPPPIRTSSVRCCLPPADRQFDEARAKSTEAQFEGWECRDLLGAGGAGYRYGVVALNVGLQAAGKRHHIPSCNGWGDRDASAQLG
jgi:hypothetical protein